MTATLQSRGKVNPATLVRWVRGAVLAHPYARVMSEDEIDATAQTVIVRVIGAYGTHPDRESVGQKTLSNIVRNLIADESADARALHDCASEYRTRRMRQADTGPMVVPMETEFAPGEDDDSPGRRSLSESALSRPGEPIPVQGYGTVPLADATLRRLPLMMAADDRDAVRVALIAAGIAADGTRQGKALAVIARSAGCSPRTCARRLERGRAILSHMSIRDLRQAMRDAVDASPLLRARTDDSRPVLEDDLRTALAGVEAAKLAGYRAVRPGVTGSTPMHRVPASCKPITTNGKAPHNPCPGEDESDSAMARKRARAAVKRAEHGAAWEAFIAARESDPEQPMPDRMEAARFYALLGQAIDDRSSATSRNRADYLLRTLYGTR